MRPHVLVFAIGLPLLIPNTAAAQKDSASQAAGGRAAVDDGGSRRFWIVPAGIALSAALDPEAREWALHEHTNSLNRLAKSVNPLGTAQRLVPAMALTYIAALLTGHQSLANGTLNTAAAYAASDLAESAIKPVIGRERPHVEGNSHRFHPVVQHSCCASRLGQDLRRPALGKRCDREHCPQLHRQQCDGQMAREALTNTAIASAVFI